MPSLKSIDLFGAPIELNYKNEKTLKTQFGAALTLIAGVVTLILIYVFGNDIFFRAKPSVSFSKVMRNSSDVYMKDFPVAIYIIDPLGHPLDVNPLITLYGEQFIFGNADEVETVLKNVTFSPCTEKHFGKFAELYKSVSKLAICPEFGEHTKFSNEYVSPQSSFINIKVAACNNATRAVGNKCASQEVINAKLSEFYVTTYFPDYYVDPLIYKNPDTLFLNFHSQRVGLSMYRRNYFRFRTVDILTDIGIFTSDPTTKSFPQLSDIRMDLDFSNRDPNLKYHITLESPKISDVYSRSYIKLIFIIANVGGITSLLLGFFTLINSRISEYSFYFQESKDFIKFSSDVLPPAQQNESRVNIIKFKEEKIQTQAQTHDARSNAGVSTIGIEVRNPHFQVKTDNNLRKLRTEALAEVKSTQANILLGSNFSQSASLKLKELKLSREGIGFCGYLKTKCSSRSRLEENKLRSEVYDSIIDYFKSQLDIIRLMTLSNSVETLKFILVGNKSNCDQLFKLKLQPEDVLQRYRLKQEEEQKDEKEDAIEAVDRLQDDIMLELMEMQRNVEIKRLFN